MIQSSSIAFLRDLRENNHREWFHDNKKRYENYKKNYLEIVSFLLKELQNFDFRLAELQVKNCTFRINRDIRFSKDKSPYKTHMSVWIPMGTGKKNTPGYYFHIEEGNCFVAGGMYMPEQEDLKRIRREVAFFYDDLENITHQKSFLSHFKSLDRDEKIVLKTAPKGYEKDHKAIHWLQLKSFTATKSLGPNFWMEKDSLGRVIDYWKILAPLNEFLLRAINTEE